MFIHLHTRSWFSFLEGLASPVELSRRAALLGMPALALTDHNRLSGAIEFYDACREAGVQPVLGLELDVCLPPDLSSAYAGAGAGPLTLLATSLEGWASLCRLSSAAQSEPAAPQPITFERLRGDAGGLLCLSGGRPGLAARLASLAPGSLADGDNLARRWLAHLGELFPDRLYIELQRHTLEDRRWGDYLSRLAAILRLPTVATHNVFYLSSEQAGLQRVVTGIRLNRTLNDLSGENIAPPGAYFTSPAEMAELFADDPGALERSGEIAGRCRLELPLGRAHFPVVDLLPGVTPIQALRDKASQGARRRYALARSAAIPLEIQSRLEHELAVIEQSGYEALFLVMEEIVELCPPAGHPDRLAWLGIFIAGGPLPGDHHARPGAAEPVFRALPEPGARHAAGYRHRPVLAAPRRSDRFCLPALWRATVWRWSARSTASAAARRCGRWPRLMGCRRRKISALAERLPYRWYGPPERIRQDEASIRRAAASDTAPPRTRQIFQDAAALIGLPRHLSIHPGRDRDLAGALTDLAPTQMATKGVVITQFDLDSIERLGLVKIDLLGIRGLTVLGDVAAADPAGAGEPEAAGASAGPSDRSGVCLRSASRKMTRRPPRWSSTGAPSAASRSKALGCAPRSRKSTPAA